MTPLAPDYLAAMAAQMGSISAFLGGFAATFLALFLTLSARSRAASVAIFASTLAAAAFIVTVIGTMMLAMVLHPSAPAGAAASAPRAQVVSGLCFLAGICALLVSLGASGWVRSARTGWTTSGIVVVGTILAFSLLAS